MSQDLPEPPNIEFMHYKALRAELTPAPTCIATPIQVNPVSESPKEIYDQHAAAMRAKKLQFALSNGGSNFIEAVTLTADNVGNGLSYHCSRGGSFLEPILYVVGALAVVGIVLSALSLIISIALGALAVYVIAKIAIAMFE